MEMESDSNQAVPEYYAKIRRSGAANSQEMKKCFKVCEKIIELITAFAKTNGFKLHVDVDILLDVVKMASRDIDKIIILDEFTPNQYKTASAWMVWFVRLKPISLMQEDFPGTCGSQRLVIRFINEMFAIFLGFVFIFLNKQLGDDQYKAMLKDDSLMDFLSVLRYRVASRHAVELILKTLYQCDPHRAVTLVKA